MMSVYYYFNDFTGELTKRETNMKWIKVVWLVMWAEGTNAIIMRKCNSKYESLQFSSSRLHKQKSLKRFLSSHLESWNINYLLLCEKSQWKTIFREEKVWGRKWNFVQLKTSPKYFDGNSIEVERCTLEHWSIVESVHKYMLSLLRNQHRRSVGIDAWWMWNNHRKLWNEVLSVLMRAE